MCLMLLNEISLKIKYYVSKHENYVPNGKYKCTTNLLHIKNMFMLL